MGVWLLALAKSIYYLSPSLFFSLFFFFFILLIYHILQNIQSSVAIHKMTTKNTLQEKRLPTVNGFNIAAQAKENVASVLAKA